MSVLRHRVTCGKPVIVVVWCSPSYTATLERNASGYDEEARYFDAGVRGDKRAGLLSALQEAVWPLYETQLTALRARTLTDFKKALKAALIDSGEGFTSAASRCCTS